MYAARQCASVTQELAEPQKLSQLLALALLYDAGRRGDVASMIRQRYGQAAIKAPPVGFPKGV
jgi:hypothetical protein